mmetsp:Transcript_52876/g.113330  ORF Transcript_52876/g.113330 Transcript_52876/m.113330 type:complete len:316 (+) Transcript_52876:67-1014(+)
MSLDVMKLSAQLQNIVHGSSCTLVVPGFLLLGSAVMLAYRQVTEGLYDLPLNGFLANIMLQMMPLVALKAKIYTCNDRVSLVPLVLVKTLLMHVVLEIMRICSQVAQGVGNGKLNLCVDSGNLILALIILRVCFEFPLSPARVLEHHDVRNLIALAIGAAFVSEAFFIYVQPSWMSEATRQYTKEGLVFSKVFFVASNYVDIVAIMPLVWRIYQAENELDDCAVGTVVSAEAKRQVQYFFAFLVCFYAYDDVIDPVMSLLDEPLAMMAHAAHFMLLLDFAGFFLFQASQVGTSTVAKERGEQLQGLLAEGAFEDD